MVTSNVATTAIGGRPSRVALREAGVNLAKLFGPEHGLAGTAADGAKVADDVDPLTGLPVVSLYGKALRPTRESIEDLDAIVYDIPDVGARFYTYIWTLSHVMEAAAEAGKPLYVLDRPNPIGGDLDGGRGADAGRSEPVELRRAVEHSDPLFADDRRAGAAVECWSGGSAASCTSSTCAGWRRAMHWPETGLPFIEDVAGDAVVRDGVVLSGDVSDRGDEAERRARDGCAVSHDRRAVGRRRCGGRRDERARQLPGLHVRAAEFVPEGRKYAGERCRGVMLEATDAKSLRPVAVGLHLIATLIRLHREASSGCRTRRRRTSRATSISTGWWGGWT